MAHALAILQGLPHVLEDGERLESLWARTMPEFRPWFGQMARSEFGGAAIACLRPFAGVVATVLTGES